MIDNQYLMAALPFIGGWIVWVSKTVSAHDQVIKNLDKLVQVMLEDRLDA